MKPRSACGLLLLTLVSPITNAAIVLTDATVFSSNEIGRNYLSLIWNTQGKPADGPDRWNLYFSSSTDPNSPVFLNGFNDAQTNISIDLATPGTYTFGLFAESVPLPAPPDPALHFVLNLYFGNVQSAPRISGLDGPTCPGVCPAGDFNGLDIFGNSFAQEAGTLTFVQEGLMVTLAAFDWPVQPSVDKVWPHWHNAPDFDRGSGTPDFVGGFALTVAAVPEPDTLLLLGLSLACVAIVRARARRRKE
jgi:hypothetical protein